MRNGNANAMQRRAEILERQAMKALDEDEEEVEDQDRLPEQIIAETEADPSEAVTHEQSAYPSDGLMPNGYTWEKMIMFRQTSMKMTALPTFKDLDVADDSEEDTHFQPMNTEDEDPRAHTL